MPDLLIASRVLIAARVGGLIDQVTDEKSNSTSICVFYS
jgi:hypothetical protein